QRRGRGRRTVDVIDPDLSHLSDLAFEGAMAGYLVALVCHAAESAGRRARARQADDHAHAPSRDHAMAGGAGTGGGAVSGMISGAPTDPPAGTPARHPSLGERLGVAAVLVTS